MMRLRTVRLEWSVLALSVLAGCGGGGGGSTPPAAGDFSISATPTSLALENGQSKTLQVSVTAVNSYSSNVSVAVTGLPPGVVADPATFSLVPGGHQQVTVVAAATAPAATASVTFQGVSGSLSHSAQMSLTLSYVSPDFSLYVNPASLSVDTGSSQKVTVGVTGSNGFSSNVTVSVSGLMAGVTANPATFTIAPGAEQQVNLAAGASAAAGSNSITFSGTSGSLSHSAQTAVTVVAAVTSMHAPIRTRNLRTDASFYDVNNWQWEPPRFTAYDNAHQQFFVSNPYLNKIDVFSGANEVETAKISIPGGPWGLDVSPFDGYLYVGTRGGDIYVVNTGTLAVTKRYPASAIGFAATDVLALPGGQFALVDQFFADGGVGNYSAVWDPAANTLDTGPPGTGMANICYPVDGPFALSGDRKRFLMASTNYCGSSCQVCSYDPVLKQATIAPADDPVRAIVPSPDGTRFFEVVANQVVSVDAKSLQVLAKSTGPFAWNGNSPLFDSGVISTDGKTLYLYDLIFGGVGAFDSSTLAQVGWVPSAPSDGNFTNVTMMGNVGAIDPTGLILGSISGGVEFIDAALTKLKEPTQLGPYFPIPESGPASGGTVLNDVALVYDIQDGATID